MTTNTTTTLVRSPHILASELEDEVVMMDVESGSYFSMPGPSGRIWQLLETEQTVQTISQTLASEYDVSVETCETELVPFVTTLLDRNLIMIPNGNK